VTPDEVIGRPAPTRAELADHRALGVHDVEREEMMVGAVERAFSMTPRRCRRTRLHEVVGQQDHPVPVAPSTAVEVGGEADVRLVLRMVSRGSPMLRRT
jgi:hypothetical protein